MVPPADPVSDFIHATDYTALPTDVRHQMHRCMLDLVGVAAAGTRTPMSCIARDHAHRHGPGGPTAPRLLFDGRRVTPPYAAMANAATIDSMDGHDGHRLVKGHAGAAILPAVLALLDQKDGADTRDLLAAMAVGYEVALRAGFRLHRTTSEYHSSGAWNALGAAAVGSRLLGLDTTATHHALGIAEYSAPRAPMMRAIAHPTMVKDSSAWGAQTGVAAALLAADGFTGAPAELLATQDDWADLGTTWRCLEQYFKPYPVCRWAHPAVTAVLDLVSRHHFTSADIADVEVTTFQAAVELSTQSPENTEQAQYSLPFAIATALAHGTLTPDTLLEPKTDPTTCRLLDIIRMKASPEMSAEFPGGRRAAADLRLRDGRVFSSGPVAAKGDPEDPMTDAELSTKFRLYTSHLGHSDSLAELLARDTVIPAEQLLSAMARPGDGQS